MISTTNTRKQQCRLGCARGPSSSTDAAILCLVRVPFGNLEIDVGVGREHLVQVVGSALVNRGGIVHQQLLDLQAVRNFLKAQHASIEHDRGGG